MGRDKELETLEKITSMERNLLGSLYGDFFSSSNTSGSGVKEPSAKEPVAPEKAKPEEKKDAPADSSQSAIQNANEALEEAKALFATGGGAPAPKEEEKPAEPEEDPMETLDGLIGLTTIKEDVKDHTPFVKVQKARHE